jgi:multidrug efflux pump subunit AcrB
MKKHRKKKEITPVATGARYATVTGASFGAMSNDRRKAFIVALLLSIVTVVLYSGVLGDKFLCYDDNDYVTTNIHVQKGYPFRSPMSRDF